MCEQLGVVTNLDMPQSHMVYGVRIVVMNSVFYIYKDTYRRPYFDASILLIRKIEFGTVKCALFDYLK